MGERIACSRRNSHEPHYSRHQLETCCRSSANWHFHWLRRCMQTQRAFQNTPPRHMAELHHLKHVDFHDCSLRDRSIIHAPPPTNPTSSSLEHPLRSPSEYWSRCRLGALFELYGARVPPYSRLGKRQVIVVRLRLPARTPQIGLDSTSNLPEICP